MKQNKWFCRELNCRFWLCVLMLTFAMVLPAIAAEPIEPDRDVSLTISYMDSTTPITGAEFTIYRVADVDKYADITLTGQFASYPVHMDDLDQDEWQELAATLNGYAKRDQIPAFQTAVTDPNGAFSVTLKPGLYLIAGERTTIGDYIYTPSPFMIFLPGSDLEENTWDYTVAAEVKYTKEDVPKTVTRKVLKVWDDKGYEEKRPDSITVQLLCDGEVYDTQLLTEENLWRYTWEELDAEHEWLVVEKELSGYHTQVSLDGITFIVTNQYIVPLADDDPPVVKKITGDTPDSPATFTFVFTAEEDTDPMPKGSNGNTKEVTITGAGSKEIGKIIFKEPGVYVYTITEKNTGEAGYVYDDTVYTLTYTITRKNGRMIVDRKITDTNGKKANTPVFTNQYTGHRLPQTGMLWWPVPILLSLGLIFCILGILQRRLHKDDKK